MARLRILTWHVHGSYLACLAHSSHEFLIPVRPSRPPGYAGLPSGRVWPDNLHEIPAEKVSQTAFDVILFQSHDQYLVDQFEILTERQRRLPKIFLEHDPPRESPTDTRHPVADGTTLVVHVTAFNDLMWDCGRNPTRVIEHGVVEPPGVRYSGELERGLVVVNHLARRGRRLGSDLFEQARREVPLDLVGMGANEAGGLGEIPALELPAFSARYRFFFNPIRYTSLGLAVCEAMMIGMPIVGFATTELVTVIENGVSGYIDTDPRQLWAVMRRWLAHPDEARCLGEGARRRARSRFGIARFRQDWDQTFVEVANRSFLNTGNFL
jgi:hypothetical protein